MPPFLNNLAESALFQRLLGLGFGIVCGLIPLALGLAYRRRSLAWRGFATAVFAGLFFGACPGPPIALVFTFLILARGPAPRHALPVERDESSLQRSKDRMREGAHFSDQLPRDPH